MSDDRKKKWSPFIILLGIVLIFSDVLILTAFGNVIIRIISCGRVTTISEGKSSLENLFMIKRVNNIYSIGLGFSTLIGLFSICVIFGFILSVGSS